MLLNAHFHYFALLISLNLLISEVLCSPKHSGSGSKEKHHKHKHGSHSHGRSGEDWSRSRGGYSRQGGSPYQQSFGGGGGGGSYGGNQGPGPFGGGGGEGSYGGRQQGPGIQIPVGAPGNYG